MASGISLCQRCEQNYWVAYDADRETRSKAMDAGIHPPALSRTDNETYVCSSCGTDEALGQFLDGFLAPKETWPVRISDTTQQIESSVRLSQVVLDDSEDGEA